jgi:AcrR family transcriptional regulator
MTGPQVALKASPQQARSAGAMRRVLEATERLLGNTLFEDLSIHSILEEANVSVGSFYARFHRKEDLLPLLYADYSRELAKNMADWLAPERWRGVGLEDRIRRLLDLAVETYRARQGLLRTVALLARSRPGQVPEVARAERRDQYEAAERLLLECRSEIRHANPALAVRMAILFSLSACREKILFSEAPHPASVRVSDLRLAEELARAVHAYLCAGEV